jgi:hypothetical protein
MIFLRRIMSLFARTYMVVLQEIEDIKKYSYICSSSKELPVQAAAAGLVLDGHPMTAGDSSVGRPLSII